MHQYIPNPASFDGSIIIYELENTALSSGKSSWVLSVTFITLPNVFSQEPPHISHFDVTTGSTLFLSFPPF